MFKLNSECGGDLLTRAANVVIHSGNVATWSKLRKKGVLSSTDELVSILEASFKSWLGRPSQENEVENGCVLVRNAGLCQQIGESERSNYIFTVKVFLTQWGTSEDVQHAVQTTLKELGLTSIDTLIVALPAPTSDVTLHKMKPVWEGMESLARVGVAREIGTVDLDKKLFEELYNWSAVKPKINHINLAHCCTMPEDLVEFCKLHDVRLLSHNDEGDIIPSARLQAGLDTALDGLVVDHAHWKPAWVTKYSSIIRLRGIVAHKGYLMNLATEL